MLREKELLIKDMRKSIEFIEKALKKEKFENFQNDEKLQKAILYELIVIGEICGVLRKKHNFENNDLFDFLKQNRNFITHKYYISDEETQWEVLKNDIPKLKKQIEDERIEK